MALQSRRMLRPPVRRTHKPSDRPACIRIARRRPGDGRFTRIFVLIIQGAAPMAPRTSGAPKEAYPCTISRRCCAACIVRPDAWT